MLRQYNVCVAISVLYRIQVTLRAQLIAESRAWRDWEKEGIKLGALSDTRWHNDHSVWWKITRVSPLVQLRTFSRWCEWKINRIAQRNDSKYPLRNRIGKYQDVTSLVHAFFILHDISYIWNHRFVRCINRSMDCYTIVQQNCNLGNDNKRPSHVELLLSCGHH